MLRCACIARGPLHVSCIVACESAKTHGVLDAADITVTQEIAKCRYLDRGFEYHQAGLERKHVNPRDTGRRVLCCQAENNAYRISLVVQVTVIFILDHPFIAQGSDSYAVQTAGTQTARQSIHSIFGCGGHAAARHQ